MLEATSEERSMRESGPNSTSLSPNKVLGTIERDQPYSSSGDEHGEDWVAFLPS